MSFTKSILCSRPFRIVSLTFAAAALWGCGPGPQEHTRDVDFEDVSFDLSPRSDQLLFSAAGKGNRDLYLLNLRDNRVTPVTSTDEYESDPCFSPDGNTIAYTAGKRGDRADHLFVMAPGHSARQITSEDFNDHDPHFSPDGKTLVFTRDQVYGWGGAGGSSWGSPDIYTINLDTFHLKRLTGQSFGGVWRPQYDESGMYVIFAARHVPTGSASSADDLFKVGISDLSKGKKPQQLTYTGASNSPFISSRGELIAFASSDHGGISLFNTKTLYTRALVSSEALGKTASLPVISKGLQEVLFFARGLWEIGIDGANLHQIASLTLFTSPMQWQPAKVPANHRMVGSQIYKMTAPEPSGYSHARRRR